MNAFLHAADGNTLISGSSQEGADSYFLWLAMTGSTPGQVDSWNAGTGEGTAGWAAGDSHPSDGNIQVFATAVPVPAAVWLLGSGIAGLAAVRRRIRKQS